VRRLLSLTAVLALLSLSFAACGDDDQETLTGTTSSSGSSASGGITTAGAFLDASSSDQESAVEDAVSAAGSVCNGVDTKAHGEFQNGVAIDAASASPDTPLSQIVSGQCAEN
jgi:hypothetical protein